MYFGDCVLSFYIFPLFTCGDHGDPQQLSLWSNSRSFLASMVPTIHIWPPQVVVSFCLYTLTNFLCAILGNFSL